MDIQALLFDVNGTLVDIETDERMEEAYRAISHFLTYQGITLHRGEVLELYFQVMKEQFADCSEKWPEFDVVAIWREILRRNASSYTRSLSPEKIEQMPLFIAEMQRGISRKRLCAYPQAPEVLAQLKKHYLLAIVSDAQSAYGLPELRAAGLAEFFDPIIISGDCGYRKPEPRLFQKALDQLRVRPENAIFVGNDRYRDVFGAQQLGMKTVLFASGPTAHHAHDAEPDYIIYHFSELPTAIEFLAAR
ncbi:MAG: HAD family hydrolase [Acidobacteriota bacterium]|nr:HAD family hydrolase [Acidobacteriota bacterium]